MELIQDLINKILDPQIQVVILAVLLAVSEALALIPAVKSNSVFQLVVNFLKKLAPKKEELK